jgi:hypothetical protein
MKSRKHKFKKKSQYIRNVVNRDLNDSLTWVGIQFWYKVSYWILDNYAYKVQTSSNTNELSEFLKDDAPHNEA